MSQSPDPKPPSQSENSSATRDAVSQRALTQLADINAATLISKTRGILFSGGCFFALLYWQIESLWMHEAGWLNLLLAPGLLFGIALVEHIEQLVGWRRWRINLEAALKEDSLSPAFTVRLSEDTSHSRSILARYRDIQYPERTFSKGSVMATRQSGLPKQMRKLAASAGLDMPL